MNGKYIENTTEQEIKTYWDSLNSELKSFDSIGSMDIDDFLNKIVYVKGIHKDGNLAGIGGLFKSFGFHFTFHLVKKEYQRQGIGDEITKSIINYSLENKIKYVLASLFPWNISTVKMTEKQGYKVFYKDSKLWWLYLPIYGVPKYLDTLIKLYYSPILLPVRVFRNLSRNKKRVIEGDVSEQEFRSFWNSLSDELKTFGSVLEDLLSKVIFFKGIHKNGELVGVGGLYKSFGFYFTFYIVKKEYQRQGIGNELIKSIVNYSLENNIEYILAVPYPWNTASIKLVKKHGYEVFYEDSKLMWSYLAVYGNPKNLSILISFIKLYYSPILSPIRTIRGLISKFNVQKKLRGNKAFKLTLVYLFSKPLQFYEYIRFLCGNDFKKRWYILNKFRIIHRNVNCLHTEGELLRIADYLLRLKGINGDFIECGAYNGGATAKLSILAGLFDINLYACDSFEGLPQIEGIEQKFFKKGEYESQYGELFNNVGAFGIPDKVKIIKGWFNKTLPELKNRWVLIFEDADNYDSVKDCLDNLWDNLDGRMYTHEMLFPITLQAYKEKGLEVKQVGLGITCSNLGYVQKGE